MENRSIHIAVFWREYRDRPVGKLILVSENTVVAVSLCSEVIVSLERTFDGIPFVISEKIKEIG